MDAVETPMCLGQLARGQFAVVENLLGCPENCERLAAMGFCAGALIRMVCPGSPCAVQVGQCRLTLRGSHLDAIQVCPV
jgi:Fe2+ transport system protein FeoA